MATYDLEEQEQLDELKTWWKMHGNLVTTVALVAALGLLAWQGWNWWQRNQAAQASGIYGGLQMAVAQQDTKRVRDLAGELIDKYPRTTYAGLGVLLAGKVLSDAGDGKSAQAQLNWAADNASDDTVRDLARLRLAILLLDEKSYDAALQRLATEPQAAFAARYAEVRGDALAAQGKNADAKAAYEAALSKVGETKAGPGMQVQEAYREMLQSKLDSLGAGK